MVMSPRKQHAHAWLTTVENQPVLRGPCPSSPHEHALQGMPMFGTGSCPGDWISSQRLVGDFAKMQNWTNSCYLCLLCFQYHREKTKAATHTVFVACRQLVFQCLDTLFAYHLLFMCAAAACSEWISQPCLCASSVESEPASQAKRQGTRAESARNAVVFNAEETRACFPVCDQCRSEALGAGATTSKNKDIRIAFQTFRNHKCCSVK